jgi:flavodoxin
MSKKILIAYFSRNGGNYVGGKIVNLKVGNTEVAAKYIQELIGGETFQINPIKPYPVDYTETTEIAKQELKAKARPELKEKVSAMDSYDIIFLGYPNWWGTFPMAVFTFLESYDFSEKTIIPFCTHEGSGLGKSVADILQLCPKAKILDGLAIQGSAVGTSRNEVSEWLGKVKF